MKTGTTLMNSFSFMGLLKTVKCIWDTWTILLKISLSPRAVAFPKLLRSSAHAGFSTIFSSVWKTVHTEHFLSYIRKILLSKNNLSDKARSAHCATYRGMLNMYKFMCFFFPMTVFSRSLAVEEMEENISRQSLDKPTISIMFHFLHENQQISELYFHR